MPCLSVLCCEGGDVCVCVCVCWADKEEESIYFGPRLRTGGKNPSSLYDVVAVSSFGVYSKRM